MPEKTPTPQNLIAEFAVCYLEKIFYFCLKKTGDAGSAEDLMQDIALNVITSLSAGTIPSSFSAWVWKIARNRYSVWADKKHRRTESIAAADIGDYEIPDDSAYVLDDIIRGEQISLLRRELAFIASDYRNIVLAYYIENKSVRSIALEFSLSESAVKQRLSRARNILKEGMNMAREFGVRSYSPDEVTFSNNCDRPGDKNQPYSIMEHKLYQNIFLEVYGNPSSKEALSLELGVALPYMEDELEYLTKETFLIKKDNKYQTSFPIVSLGAQEQVHIAQLTAAPDITQALTAFVDRLNAAFEAVGYKFYGRYQDYESAKWSLLMLAYDHFMHATPRSRGWTQRPDNGRWDMIGYQKCDINEPNFVGNHGADYGFQQFKYEFDGISNRTPPFLTSEEAKILRDFALGTVDGDVEISSSETVKALEKYGYLHRSEGGYVPDVLVLNVKEIKRAFESLDGQTASELLAMAQNAKKLLKDLYNKVAQTVKSDLPKIFSKDEFQLTLVTSSMYHSRGYVMSNALRSGWLKPADEVSYTIGAHIYE